MTLPLRRLFSVGLLAALGVAAAPLGKVQFTDTTLKNGLRVIISEDHSGRRSIASWGSVEVILGPDGAE